MHISRASQSRYDAVVVGARCAGAATALLLARAGAKVLLIDRQPYGSDTMSTHALMRTGVLQLQRWGLLPAVMAAGTPKVRASTFHYGREQVRVDIRAEHGVEYLCAPRRTVLDRILVDAARAAGAEVHHDVRLMAVALDTHNRVVGAELQDLTGAQTRVRCDMLIGADGRDSTVARLVKAAPHMESATWSGCVYGYYENLHRDGFHWHFGDRVAASVISTNAAQHCVVASVPSAAFAQTFRGDVEGGFLQVLAANAPELAADVRRARLVGRLRGFAGVPGHFRNAHGPGWALVGDAGYYKDPLTAHGITDALRDAELLVHALLRERLDEFQPQRDALSRQLFEVTDAITAFGWDLDQVKTLHTRLSAAMRAETAHIASMGAIGAKEHA